MPKNVFSSGLAHTKIEHQLKSIDDVELSTLLYQKITHKVENLRDHVQREHLTHHVFSILRKIQLLKSSASVRASIQKIILEKNEAWEHKKIKSFHLFVRAVEEAISDLHLKDFKLGEPLEEENESKTKKEPELTEEEFETELEEPEEEPEEPEEEPEESEESEEEHEHEEHAHVEHEHGHEPHQHTHEEHAHVEHEHEHEPHEHTHEEHAHTEHEHGHESHEHAHEAHVPHAAHPVHDVHDAHVLAHEAHLFTPLEDSKTHEQKHFFSESTLAPHGAKPRAPTPKSKLKP